MATATKSKTNVNLKPLEDRVVLQPSEPEERTTSGIYLPDSAQEKPMTGKVLAVGPGKLDANGNRAPTVVKQGQTVLYGKYAGTEIELDGDTVMILRESELLGVVEK